MRRGFVAGPSWARSSIAVGVFAAVLPSTPTWALWRLKSAIDANDTEQIGKMVDIASVTQRAVDELDGRNGLDLGQLAAVVMGGGKGDDGLHRPRAPARDHRRRHLSAWWGTRRDGDLAYFTLPTGEKTVDLVLGNQPSKGWASSGSRRSRRCCACSRASAVPGDRDRADEPRR